MSGRKILWHKALRFFFFFFFKLYKCFLTLAVPVEGGWYLDQKLLLLELPFQVQPGQ